MGHRAVPKLVWAGPVLGAIGALALVLPVFGGRPPAGEDVMPHLVRADFGIDALLAHGRIDGWFPRFALGHQEFLFNGPGLTWLVALVRALTLGALSNTGALKVVAIASFVAVPPAMWFLARSFGLGRRGAGWCAVLALFVSGPYGPGLGGTFAVGLISHQVGAVFFLVAFGAVVRILDDRRTRWVLLAAGALAAMLVTHVISVLVLAVMLAVTLGGMAVARRLSWPGLLRLGLAGVAGAGLAGFWLVPAVAHRGLRGFVTTWGTPPLLRRLESIMAGDVLLPAGMLALVAVAAVWVAARRRSLPAGLVVCAVVPAAYLLIAHGVPHVVGANEATMQLANRGLGYGGLVAVIPLAALGAWLTRRARPAVHAGLLVLTVVAALVFAPDRGKAEQMGEPVPALRAAAAELARIVPDGARFATQRDFPGEVVRTNVIHPEYWLARQSGRNTLNGFNVESSSTPGATVEVYRLGQRPPASSARALARFGVSHVVTTTNRLSRDLAGSGYFTLHWREPPVAILAVQPRPGNPAPGHLMSSSDEFRGELVEAEPERLRFRVVAEEPVRLTVALAWSPKWSGVTGHDDTEALPVGRTSDGLVRLDLPAGATTFTLDYGSDGWDRLGLAVSVLTALAVAAQLMSRRRRST